MRAWRKEERALNVCVFVSASVVWGNFWLVEVFVCISRGICMYVCVNPLRWCVSPAPPPAGDHWALFAEVNDLVVQSHSPARAPSLTATGGLAN